MKRLLVVFLAIACPAFLYGGGFQINLQGIRAVGMGGSLTGVKSDASAIFFNPGAMSFLKGHSVTAGINFISPSKNYTIYSTTIIRRSTNYLRTISLQFI